MHLRRDSRIAGFSLADLIAVLAILAVMVTICLPAALKFGQARARELSNRSYCAANIKGILTSFAVYANENEDAFPVVLNDSTTKYNAALTPDLVAANAEETITGYYAGKKPKQLGSPAACLWILVLKNQTSAKQFICKSDPFIANTPSPLTDKESGKFFNNFDSVI